MSRAKERGLGSYPPFPWLEHSHGKPEMGLAKIGELASEEISARLRETWFATWVGEAAPKSRTDLPALMRATLEAFSKYTELLALQHRLTILEATVSHLQSTKSAQGKAPGASDEAEDPFTTELMELISECGGLPQGDIPEGYSLEDPVED